MGRGSGVWRRTADIAAFVAASTSVVVRVGHQRRCGGRGEGEAGQGSQRGEAGGEAGERSEAPGLEGWAEGRRLRKWEGKAQGWVRAVKDYTRGEARLQPMSSLRLSL